MAPHKTFIFSGLTLIVIGIIAGMLFMETSITGNTMKENSNTVKFETTAGDIVIELNPEAAPITVANFLSYVDSGYYDGLVFHRVINGFMIQGGGFYPNGTQKETNAPITLESQNGLSNNKGTIAMARTNNPNSATSQFFINTVDNDFLNYNARSEGYAVFGTVTKGMDVVEKIEKTQTGVKNRMQDWPIEDIIIVKAYRI